MSRSSSEPHNFHPDYRPDIDGLRAVAILAVVIFHAFPKALRGGFVGVDVFFVISGFLISTIIFRSLRRGGFSFLGFYANRVRRIFPALILVLGSCVLLGWFALLPDEFAQLGKHVAGGAGFVQNFLLWSEAGYFDTQSELKPLMHLWSLAIEEQFYLFYPLLMGLAWWLRPSLPWVLLALIGVSLGLNLWRVGHDPVGTFFLPHTRFWELLAGGLLAALPLSQNSGETGFSAGWRDNHPIVNHGLSILGLLLILIASLLLNKGRQFPSGWALLPVAGSALLILSGQQAWVNRVVLSSRWMVFIGLISYPLYLWHWPLLAYARILESEEPASWVRAALLGLSFLLSWMTWRLVERPLRFGPKSAGRLVMLCGLMLGLGVLGVWIHAGQGLPGRFNTAEFRAFDWAPGAGDRAFCREAFLDPGYPESCRLQEGTQPDIALLGDSHSGHLYPGLVGQGLKVVNLGRAACLPLYDVGFGPGGSECPFGYMNRVLDFAVTDDRVKLIVLAARYAAAVEGGEYDGRHPGRPGVMSLFTGSSRDNDEAFRMALRETFRRLSATGKPVVVALDVPELGFNPKSCIRPLTLSGSRRDPCAISLEAFEQRSRKYREIVRSVARDFPSVRLFDLAGLLCDDAHCWAKKDGQILYRDDDHLSLEGSDWVARGLGAYLKSVLP